MSAELLFKDLSQGAVPAVMTLFGDDAYLRREFMNLLKKKGFEITHKHMGRKGPELMDEDLSYSTSLFSSQTLAWLETEASEARWSAESKDTWNRMCERADGESLVLVLQVPAPTKEFKLKKGDYLFEVSPDRSFPWIKRMNQVREAGLDEKRLRFLNQLDKNLLELDQCVELWGLGGDAWAAVAIGYSENPSEDSETFNSQQQNPAFSWVDACIEGRTRDAIVDYKKICKQGLDPLPLLGLLSRSLRTLAALEMRNPKLHAGSAPFLVSKMQEKLRRSLSAKELLFKAAMIDEWLKSRPVDPESLMLSLASSSNRLQ